MPDQLEAAPQLRSWTRQGIDVSQLLAAAIDAIASANTARQAAITAQAAADAAVAALNLITEGGGGGGTGNGIITPTSIQGSTQIGRDLLVAPGNTYALQQAAARAILAVPVIGTGANDAAPGTLTASVAALANRVTALENSGVGGGTGGKDNIDIDTDGVPIWND